MKEAVPKNVSRPGRVTSRSGISPEPVMAPERGPGERPRLQPRSPLLPPASCNGARRDPQRSHASADFRRSCGRARRTHIFCSIPFVDGAGYSARDPDYWECAFAILLRFATPELAKILHGKFRLFTQTLNERTRREIMWRFSACRCLCRDEFLVLRLVAAAQRKDENAETLAAPALLGGGDVEDLLHASRSLATALQANGFTLAPIERLPIVASAPHAPHSYTLQ